MNLVNKNMIRSAKCKNELKEVENNKCTNASQKTTIHIFYDNNNNSFLNYDFSSK